MNEPFLETQRPSTEFEDLLTRIGSLSNSYHEINISLSTLKDKLIGQVDEKQSLPMPSVSSKGFQGQLEEIIITLQRIAGDMDETLKVLHNKI